MSQASAPDEPDEGVPLPEEDHEKEVYAFFGLAAYEGQVLERGLFNLATVLRAREEMAASLAEFDRVFEELHGHTFGRLLRYAAARRVLSLDLLRSLDEAVRKRNYLAHLFFWERAPDFFVTAGRREMICELREAAIQFKRANRTLQAEVRDVMVSVGLTDQLLEEERERLLREAHARYGGA